MARISYVRRDRAAPAARSAFDDMAAYGPFGNLAGAMAHRPPILANVFRMMSELRGEGVLPRRSLELALVAVSRLNECEYCVAHHGPMLAVEGMSADGVRSVLDYEDHPEMDDADRLVVEYARAVTLEPNRVRDSLFERLREHFDEPQIVELTWRIALCGAFNRFNDVLQLEIEDDVEPLAPAAAQAGAPAPAAESARTG